MGNPATPAEKLAAGNLITDIELSALLGVSAQTLRNMRWQGRGPRHVKIAGKLVRYRPEDVAAFLAAGVREPEARA